MECIQTSSIFGQFQSDIHAVYNTPANISLYRIIIQHCRKVKWNLDKFPVSGRWVKIVGIYLLEYLPTNLDLMEISKAWIYLETVHLIRPLGSD